MGLCLGGREPVTKDSMMASAEERTSATLIAEGPLRAQLRQPAPNGTRHSPVGLLAGAPLPYFFDIIPRGSLSPPLHYQNIA